MMLHRIITPTAAVWLMCVPALAQTNQLQIARAVEMEYVTELGKTYVLQGSVDLKSWTDIGSLVYGNGQTVDQLFSTRDSTVQYASYRLAISAAPTNGYAPWSLAGAPVQMEDQTTTNVVHFLTATNGEDAFASGGDPFSYQYLRTGANDGRADRTYSPTRRDSILYSFTGAGSGTWAREEFEEGLLKNRGVGAFHFLSTGTNGGGTNLIVIPAQPPLAPASLTGAVYYVFTGSAPDKYQFNNSGNSGVATPGTSSGEVETTPTGNVFTYTYSVIDTNHASLAINFGYYGIGGDRQEYDLTFTDGASGLFNRRIYRLGSLYTTDHGVFSPNAVVTPGTNPTPPGGVTSPPSSPVGFTYTLAIDTTPIRLVFQNAAGGTEYDDSAPSEFSYSYQATGPNTFSLHVQFKADRWDDYDLTFSSAVGGTAVQRQFRNGALARTVGGTFSVARTL